MTPTEQNYRKGISYNNEKQDLTDIEPHLSRSGLADPRPEGSNGINARMIINGQLDQLICELRKTLVYKILKCIPFQHSG